MAAPAVGPSPALEQNLVHETSNLNRYALINFDTEIKSLEKEARNKNVWAWVSIIAFTAIALVANIFIHIYFPVFTPFVMIGVAFGIGFVYNNFYSYFKDKAAICKTIADSERKIHAIFQSFMQAEDEVTLNRIVEGLSMYSSRIDGNQIIFDNLPEGVEKEHLLKILARKEFHSNLVTSIETDIEKMRTVVKDLEKECEEINSKYYTKQDPEFTKEKAEDEINPRLQAIYKLNLEIFSAEEKHLLIHKIHAAYMRHLLLNPHCPHELESLVKITPLDFSERKLVSGESASWRYSDFIPFATIVQEGEPEEFDRLEIKNNDIETICYKLFEGNVGDAGQLLDAELKFKR